MTNRDNICYTGHYNGKTTRKPFHQYSNRTTEFLNSESYTKNITSLLKSGYTILCGHYLAIVTIFAVVLLSYIIPDLSLKIHSKNDLKDVKKVIQIVSNEVNRAEVECFTTSEEVNRLRFSMHDNSTETSQALEDLSACTSQSLHTTQSEPAKIDKKMGFFRRIFHPHRNTSHKEFTIMSYVYTDSFDTKKKTANDVKI